jgi:two-component system, cell cycle sensor histidine kinase and response regulator CckA
MSEPMRILYIDDYLLDRELVRDALEKEDQNFYLIEAASRAEFEARLAEGNYDLVLTDFNILGFEGLQVLDAVHAQAPHVPVVIVTGTGSEEVAVESMKRGAADYVIKTPHHIQRLPQTILAAAERQHLREERERAETALVESEERYRLIAENTSDLISLLDQEGRFVYASPSYKCVLGYDPAELIGTSAFDLIHPDDLAAVPEPWSLLRPQGTGAATFRYRHASGAWLYLDASGAVVERPGGAYVVNVSRDVTERKDLEARFRHAQKLESIGQLAGGVAHDFNNLLTAILGYAELGLELLPPDAPAYGDLEEIQKTAKRGAKLTKQLLAFARRQVIELQVLNLNDLILNMNNLLRRLIGEDIELVIRSTRDLWPIKADPNQIEQVIVNLAVNARDAMPKGGTLLIEIDNVPFDEENERQNVGVTAGEYVMLAVSDTGAGMTEAIRQKIFEPFFTTKEPGHGTGLGLATCYGIITQHGGDIQVSSRLGHGTSFKIRLPRVDGVASTLPTDSTEELPRGSETVLLVEDDRTTRALIARVLRHQGYRVLEAENGVEALHMAQELVEPIDLLLTDMIMPRMSGKALVEHFIQLYSRASVLFISGYADSTTAHQTALEPIAAFLQKPFSPAELARKVRAVLDD